MADLTAIITQLTSSLPAGTLASEKTTSNISGFSDKTSQLLEFIHSNITTLTAATQEAARTQTTLGGIANRKIEGIGAHVQATSQAVGASKSAFNLSSVQIDPSTGSGIATALAFSAFPGLAKLYVGGVEAMANAFADIDEKQLKTLQENAGSFEAMTQVIGVVQSLSFKDLLGSSIVMRFTAQKLGKNLGEMFWWLMQGIKAGAGDLLDITYDKDGKPVGETPLAKMAIGFSNIMDSVTRLLNAGAGKMLGQSLLFRMTAGFIGRNIAASIEKIFKALDPAQIADVGKSLNGVARILRKLNTFAEIDILGVLKGFAAFEKISDILAGIKVSNFKKILHIIAPFNEPTLRSAFEKMQDISTMKINWNSFKRAFKQIFLAGVIVKKIRADTFRRLPVALTPFTRESWTETLKPAFENIQTLAEIVKKTKFMSLNMGLGALAISGGLIKIVSKVFGFIGDKGWEAFGKGLDKLGKLKKKFEKVMDIDLKMFAKFAVGLSLLALPIAAVAYAFTQMPPLAQIAGGIASLGALVGAAWMMNKLPPPAIIAKSALSLGILGASIIPFAFALKMIKGLDMASVGAMALAIATVGGAVALMGLGGPLLYIGAGALAATGFALIPFAKGINHLMGVNISGFDPLKFLAVIGSITAAAGPLVLALPGLLVGSVGLMALGKGLRGLTNGVDLEVLTALGPALKSINESVGGLGAKALGMFFTGRALKTLGTSLQEMIGTGENRLTADVLNGISGLFNSFASILTFAGIQDDEFDGMTDGFEKLIKSTDELKNIDPKAIKNLGEIMRHFCYGNQNTAEQIKPPPSPRQGDDLSNAGAPGSRAIVFNQIDNSSRSSSNINSSGQIKITPLPGAPASGGALNLPGYTPGYAMA